jgi:hypothetical protein
MWRKILALLFPASGFRFRVKHLSQTLTMEPEPPTIGLPVNLLSLTGLALLWP